MHSTSDERNVMMAYLLGDLSEEQKGQVEERFLTDEEYFEELAALEQELTDRFVRGEVSARDRERFERCYLASPPRRRRVEFARALVGPAEVPVAEVRRPDRVPFGAFLRSFLQTGQPAWRYELVGAGLLVLLAGSWLIVDSARLRSQLTQARSQWSEPQTKERELDQHVARQSAVIVQLTEELRRERDRREQLEQEFKKLQRFPGGVVSFLLLPGLERASGEPKRLLVPAGALWLRIQLDVAADEWYSSYRAAVRTASGAEIWSEDMLKARATGSGRAVVLNLPSNLFVPGDYVIALSGLAASGKFESLESYLFRIVKP